MKKEGNVGVTGCQLRVALSKDQEDEVSSTVEEPESGWDLVCVVTVEGKIDIGFDRVRVVYPEHTFKDEGSFVLVGKG